MLFLRDFISFIIYIAILIFPRKEERTVALLYHSVGQINRGDDPYKVNVLPDDFERHLKIISRCKEKIEITFDDGYGNNFQNAFPLLKKYGLKATFFLVTDFIDGKIGPERFAGEGFRKERPLTWDEVKAMHGEGMNFGSHSKTHRFLVGLSEAELKKELSDSRHRLGEVLGGEIKGFAYPFGHAGSFDDLTRKALRETGYDYAYTNIMGYNPPEQEDKFALRRIRVYSGDGPLKLRMKMKGAYDWIDNAGFIGKRRRPC